MTMNNSTVILARPSFFIVNEMRSFMEDTGFDPAPLQDMSQLDQLNISPASVKGTVISTAVRSDVPEGYAEVLKILRNRYTNIPAAFATLVDFDTMAKAIRLKMEGIIDNPHVLPINRDTLHDRKLGKPETLLVIRKDDITSPESRSLAEQILNRHFH
mgnify:CR=1 FL=1